MFKKLPTSSAPAVYLDDEAESPSLRFLEVAFRGWVDGYVKPEILIVGSIDHPEVSMDTALRRLRHSTEPLAPAHGRMLGLDDDATIAVAADALLGACSDPDGPRCRSFRAASYFLSGLARINAVDMFGAGLPLSSLERSRAPERASQFP
ncbi:MAG: hypothetical protein WD358_05970 [Nitriliruptoraceae bacterium]